MRIALASVFMSLTAMCTSAAPTRLLSATFIGGCHSFTITVTGEGLNQPNAIVSYNITLTPRSGGEPVTVVDSFPVTPEQDGSFHKTITQSWEKFEFTLAGKYTLSGSALLASNLIPIHDIAIRFPRAKLKCGPRQSAR